MKKILLVLVLFFLASSSSKMEDVAGFEFNNAWYWASNYEEGTTKEEMIEHVKTFSNPNQTSYFFFYPKNLDISLFTKESFNLQSFSSTIIENKPSHAFYKMPSDPKVYEDALWLLEEASKEAK